MKIGNGILLFCLTLGARAAAAASSTVWINEDNEHFYHHPESDMSVAGCRALVDRYADTGACTGVLFCVNMQRALYDSEVWERFKDQKIEAMDPVRQERDIEYVMNLRRLSDRKVDQFREWLAQCRVRGLAAWLTMRMNDCHGLEEFAYRYAPASTCDTWHSEKWEKRPEWRRATYRREHSFESAYDFGIPEVRAHHLNLVREILGKWDMDGLELDWMRWAMHFKPGDEERGRALLTDFVREVRRLADAAEKRLGHRVLIGHRVMAHPEIAYKAGYDVAAWSAAGCVDMLTLAGFSNQTPNDLPVWLWRRMLRPGTVIVSGVTYGGLGGALWNDVHSYDVKRGNAAAAWAAGADGLMLFNECYTESENMPELAGYMRDISSPAALAKAGWRAVVSDCEAYPGYSPRRVLPAQILQRYTGHALDRMGQTVTLRLTTGAVPADATVRLSLGFTAETPRAVASNLEVRVNTTVAPRRRIFDVDQKGLDLSISWLNCPDFPRDAAFVAEYDVPVSALLPRDNAIEVIPPEARASVRACPDAAKAGRIVWCDMKIR